MEICGKFTRVQGTKIVSDVIQIEFDRLRKLRY